MCGRWLWRKCVHRLGEVGQDMRLARRDDGVHGVEPQPVEAIIAQPMQRVFDREGAHFRHAIVDRGAPGRLCPREKNCGAMRWR